MHFRAVSRFTLPALLLGLVSLGARAQDPAPAPAVEPTPAPAVAPAPAAALKYSNKWRIEVKEGANNDGVLRFRMTPKDGAAVEIAVKVKDGRSENGVAQDVKTAFKAAVDTSRYHVEGDDGEDVLVKAKGKGADFALELLEDNIKGTRIDLERE
jgi:hypothetical protein